MKKNMITLFVLGMQVLLLSQMQWVTAQDKTLPKDSTASDKPSAAESAVPVTPPARAYLGIGVEPLHPAFSGHLPEPLIEGQGVVVESIIKDSPADSAGLKVNDILTAFGDQKIFSADQLIKLVRAEKVGDEIELQVVRAGKLQTLTVKLGNEPAHIADLDHQNRDLWERRFGFAPMPPWRPRFRFPNMNNVEHWNRFESLNLTKLDGDRYKAEISYLDKDGKKQSHSFEGTRDEIRKLIETEKDLPADERDQLLRGLEMHPRFLFPEITDDLFSPDFQWPDPFRDF